MDTLKLLIAASVTFLPVTGALAAEATADAVAALKSDLGSGVDLEVDEVRETAAGVVCIEYRVRGSRGHAVVQKKEVLKSSSGYKAFEKAWNEHCLGPRGGAAPIG